MPPLNIAILASGSGSNAEAIFQKIEQGLINAKVSLIISNRPQATVLERAKNYNLATLALDHKAYTTREEFDHVLVDALQKCGAELIVLAGYMRILTPVFIQAFKNKIINVHPAILPSFIGAHGAADACQWGVKLSGCTVHFVDEEVDHGAIIAQAAVPVMDDDDASSLQKRIQTMEHRIFPQVIQWIATNRIKIENRQIKLIPSDKVQKAKFEDNNFLIWPPLEENF